MFGKILKLTLIQINFLNLKSYFLTELPFVIINVLNFVLVIVSIYLLERNISILMHSNVPFQYIYVLRVYYKGGIYNLY
jgi:hypothetical protein